LVLFSSVYFQGTEMLPILTKTFRSFVKLAGFLMSPLDLLGVRSFAKWKQGSAKGLSE
jgi:hypothetical protein